MTAMLLVLVVAVVAIASFQGDRLKGCLAKLISSLRPFTSLAVVKGMRLIGGQN